MPVFEDIVPVHVERDSREILLTNGTGNGELTIHYRTPGAQTTAIVLAILAGLAGVIACTRVFRPAVAGGAICLLCLVLLAFASYGWIAVLNGVLGGVAALTVVLWIAEKRRTA
jgi:hypothetical protein